jgi:hypothetical protein
MLPRFVTITILSSHRVAWWPKVSCVLEEHCTSAITRAENTFRSHGCEVIKSYILEYSRIGRLHSATIFCFRRRAQSHAGIRQSFVDTRSCEALYFSISIYNAWKPFRNRMRNFTQSGDNDKAMFLCRWVSWGIRTISSSRTSFCWQSLVCELKGR